MSKFEELLIQYNKTADDITFDYADLSDEELEAKFAELFGEDDPDPSSEGEGDKEDPDKDAKVDSEDDKKDESSSSESGAKGGTRGGDASTSESESSSDSSSSSESETPVWGTGETSGSKSDDEDTAGTTTTTKKKFELSMQDTIFSLTELVNATYGESDNDWYCVTAYNDYLVMTGWWNNRSYKQSYKNENDTLSLVGDRVEVYCQYLTQEEIDELAELRSNYEALVQFKADVEKEELTSQKNALIEDERFEIIRDVDAYKELVKDVEKYSLEELETKLKLIVADFALGNNTFAAFDKQKGGKMFTIPSKTKSSITSRYGGIFKDNK